MPNSDSLFNHIIGLFVLFSEIFSSNVSLNISLIFRFKSGGYYILQITLLLNTLALISCCESVFYISDLKKFLESQNLTIPIYKSFSIYLKISFFGLLLVEVLLLSCHYFSLTYFFSLSSKL
jgi:hypothetical protein